MGATDSAKVAAPSTREESYNFPNPPWSDRFGDFCIVFVVEVLDKFQIFGVERQDPSICIFQLTDHPGQGNVGNASIWPRTTNVGMRAGKPALFQ
jgi:hypothetical protein